MKTTDSMENTTSHSVTSSVSAVSIVDMTEEYLPQVLAIENECFREPWSEKVFRKTLEQTGHSKCLTAMYQERVVGFIIAWYIPQYFRESGELHIHNLAVISSMRRKGIGKQLLQQTVASAREVLGNECSVYLEVRESNSTAQTFYHSLGFQVTGFRPGYYKDEGALLMEASSENVILHKQHVRK